MVNFKYLKGFGMLTRILAVVFSSFVTILSTWYSLLRNAMKFLPWHIGHTGVIRAMYNDYSVLWFMVGNIGFLLAVIYILMVLFGKHFKHIPDMIAGKSVRERGIKINET